MCYPSPMYDDYGEDIDGDYDIDDDNSDDGDDGEISRSDQINNEI